MNSNSPKRKFIIVGLGSIGKNHLRILNSFGVETLVVDSDIEVKSFLDSSKEYDSINYYRDLNHLPNSLDVNFAVISNWGPDHVKSISTLLQLGIKKFIVEKPLASTLDSLYKLRSKAEKRDLDLVTNMPLSYGVLVKKIKEYKDSGILGDLVSVVISGGAKCLATNGIHYVGLSSKVFGATPQFVFSAVSNSEINPRNKAFLFLEGSSTWVYPQNKQLVICFANDSHVQLSMIFCFRFGKIIVEENLASVYRIKTEDRARIDKPARTFYASELIETFNPNNNEHGLNGMEEIYDQIMKDDLGVWTDFHHGFDSTEAIIAMLISSREKLQISLPLTRDFREKYLSNEWYIS